MSRELVLATRSAGKLAELAPLLRAAGWSPLTLAEAGVEPSPAEDALEVFETFEENALAKARWYVARCGGRPVVADDSGLVVPALGGAPGVRSKRWAGGDGAGGDGAGGGDALDARNNAYLLERMTGVADRRAHYVCVMAFVGAARDGTALEVTARGETHGRLLDVPRGDGGFGYDPLFWSDDLGQTFGEASRAAKSAVSHRGRALAALLLRLAGH